MIVELRVSEQDAQQIAAGLRTAGLDVTPGAVQVIIKAYIEHLDRETQAKLAAEQKRRTKPPAQKPSKKTPARKTAPRRAGKPAVA